MEACSVVVIKDNVVHEIFTFPETEINEAENCFLDCCEYYLSNFDEYDTGDKAAILDNGYETFGNGSICICHSE